MDNRDLREAIQHLSGTNKTDTVYLMDAEIVSVELETRTCTCVLIGGNASNDIPNVRLMSSVDDGFLISPTVGSTVTIILSTFTAPVIIQYSEVDLYTINGGQLGGLVVIGVALNSLNTLEKDLNNLKQLITGWVPVPGDGGASLKTLLSAWFGQEIPLTQKKDLENTNILQG